MTGQPNAAILSDAQWHAELRLRFAASSARTVLAAREHVGPLLVQRPFYPEGAVCHVYLIHPPGGIASGDQLHLKVQLEAGAHALITTPAATKFYRAAAARRATVQQHLQLKHACLEWLPQEAIFFNQASVRTITRFDVDTASKLLAWELACYGRLASDEKFTAGKIHQSLELWRDGKPLLLDHLHIAGGSDMQTAAWGLNSMTALGTLLAFPANGSDVAAARDCGIDASVVSCTLVDDVLLCRCLCTDSVTLKQQLLRVWQCLRLRILQRDTVLPRIWAT